MTISIGKPERHPDGRVDVQVDTGDYTLNVGVHFVTLLRRGTYHLKKDEAGDWQIASYSKQYDYKEDEKNRGDAFHLVLDLTQPLSERFPNWEGTEKSPFEAKPLGVMEKDGYFTRTISLPEHFATHMDAPAHFAAGAWTVDQIPPERLVGPLVVLDVSAPSRASADYQVTVDDVARWERGHGQVPPGAIVLARTGWAARAGSMKDYRNADEKGTKHFPGFLPETVKFLVEARSIYGLGIDTMSVDYGASDTYPVHQYTARHNVYHLENVADLSAVPEAGALLVAAPAKLAGGSGGPVRILALVR